MGRRDRRDFLKLALATVPAVALRARAGRGEAIPQQRPSFIFPKPGSVAAGLQKYADPLPLPARLQPIGMRGTTTLYRVRMLELEQKLHSALPATRLWGYEGQFPGPLFEAMRSHPIEVRWENQLPQKHLFSVDRHIHGAMGSTPAVRVVPHLHGSRTFAESDGMPEDWLTSGQGASYEYPNEQRAAMLWYHDHAMGITRLNVYAGLTGFYLLRDEQELSMNLPRGPYEIPLLLQDKTIDDQGQLVYTPTMEDGKPLAPGVWGPEFFGELPVVNGAIYPYLNVEPRKYRLRVVNGSNSRFFNLYLNLASRPTDIPAIVKFHQIGSDGGLLASPIEMSRLLLSPGERADLIVDFSALAGKTATLSNSASVPYPGWDMMMPMHAPLSEMMQFRVSVPLKKDGSTGGLPLAVALPRLKPAQAVITRDFVLGERVDAAGNSLGVKIDDKGYDAPCTEFPKLGTMERWRFVNTTDDAHPMHLHLVQFQVLERQGYNAAAFAQGKLVFEGEPRTPAANEAGWKDTAVVTPREVLTLLIPFEGYAGKYVFHCHMLEHEDNDMMRPFIVVDAAKGGMTGSGAGKTDAHKGEHTM